MIRSHFLRVKAGIFSIGEQPGDGILEVGFLTQKKVGLVLILS
jgi:hypothetical protein